MKYRGDFVTNSSSSSFIVCFKNKEEYRNRFSTISNLVGGQYVGTIYTDIEQGLTTKKEVLDKIYEDIKHTIEFKFLFSDFGNYDLYVEKMKDPEVKKQLKAQVEDKFNEVKASLPVRGVYSIVTYGDDEDYFSELEHYIMPHMPFVRYVINQH